MGNTCSCRGDREDMNEIHLPPTITAVVEQYDRKIEGSQYELSESSQSSHSSSLVIAPKSDLAPAQKLEVESQTLIQSAEQIDKRSPFEVERTAYVAEGFVYLPFDQKTNSETVPMMKYLLTKKAALALKDQQMDFVMLFQYLQQGFLSVSQRIQTRNQVSSSTAASTFASSPPSPKEGKQLGEEEDLPSLTKDCCEIIEESLKETGLCCAIYCTRREKLILCDGSTKQRSNSNTAASRTSTSNSSSAKYVVMYTGLDNDFDPEINSGSFFSIFRRITTKFRPISEREDLLQTCSNAIACGYCFYGQAITMTLAIGTEVNGFTYDPTQKEFLLTQPKIKAAQRLTQISIDTSKESQWEPHIKVFLNRRLLRKEKNTHIRSTGSLAADAHRTLLYGGIFMSPLNARTQEGDIHIVNAFILANIFEKSWGRASQGEAGSILQMKMSSLQQKIQFYCGTSAEVVELENLYLSIARRQSINKSIPSNQTINQSLDLSVRSQPS